MPRGSDFSACCQMGGGAERLFFRGNYSTSIWENILPTIEEDKRKVKEERFFFFFILSPIKQK